MASIDELIALIEADIGKSDSANASIEASRAEAEELAGLFTAMNVDGQAARTEQVQQALTEAVVQGPAIKAKLEEAKIRAEALKTPGSSGGRTVSAAPAPTPLTAAPQAIREPVAKVGDAVEPGPTAPNPYRQELAGTEEDDQSKSKFRRAGRAVARNIGDLQDQAKDTTTSGIQMRNVIDPPDAGHYPTIGTPDHPQITQSPAQHLDPSDMVATTIALAAVGAEILARRMRKKKG